MQKIKVNDEVVVVAGKDKDKSGKVTKIYHSQNKVVVDGINAKVKTLRRTEQNPDGGFTQIFSPIDRSNVAIKSPKDGKPSRVRIETKDGKKVRVAVRCGTELS